MPFQLQQCVFVSQSLVKETLGNEPSSGKRLLEPLKSLALQSGLPINILEDHQISNEAEVHRHEGDLWYCLEGTVTFIYGGRMVSPEARRHPDGSVHDLEIKAASIADGTEVVMHPGDWLWIPAGQPHSHRAEGTARLVIIKIPAKELVPLEAVSGWK